jgi:formylglycine-generating enzyme required for sulfatase activity
MGLNPSIFKAVAGVAKEDQKRFPVENVSWEDTQTFITALNKREKEAGWMYRLPTEVEWEYACRGGPTNDKSESAFHFYLEKAMNQLLPEQANFHHDKSLKRPCKVGSYQPNRLGLHDMHGNVWEWCSDALPSDPKGASRVGRGGGWHYASTNCAALSRYLQKPLSRSGHYGLRLARVPAGKEIVKVIAIEEKKK